LNASVIAHETKISHIINVHKTWLNTVKEVTTSSFSCHQ